MSQPQSRLALFDQRVSFTTLLRVAGADIWKDEDIKAYMDKVHKEQPVGLLFRLFGKHSALVNFCISLIVGAFAYNVTAGLQAHFDRAPDSLTAIVALCAIAKTSWYLHHHRPLDWHTNRVFWGSAGKYWRNWKQCYVPQGALALMEGIQATLPHASFSVSFLGDDPVLWCSNSGESIAIRVWDEVNGVELLVPAPR